MWKCALWYGGWCEGDRELQIFQKFMKHVKMSISIFQEIFASIDIFILGGGLGNNSMQFWHFPDIS